MKPINATRWLTAAAMATTLVLSASGGSSTKAFFEVVSCGA